jgi:RNA processing factor Prp31
MKVKMKMFSSDIKLCARQIVKESLNQILANIYEIPTLEEMKRFLEKNFDHSFDEYMVTQKIKRSHPEWSNERVAEELDKKKRKYENELRVNLRIAALNTIEEIENLIISLNNAIREWKIKHL